MEPEKLIDYEDFVIAKFKEDPELGREMVIDSIEEYHESGEEEDMTFVLLNLGRIVQAGGYENFKSVNLSESQIDDALNNTENCDRNVINKMLEALGIKERI